MLLAVNYSHPAAALYSAGKIPLDRFKCPDWPDMVAEAAELLPISVHFGLAAGSGRLAETDWRPVHHFLEGTATVYVNLHLFPKAEDYPGIPPDTSDPQAWDLVLERTILDVRAVAAEFGAERVIAENVPYRGAGGKSMRPAAEPRGIRTILEETGCGLLLDISHARIAARALEMDEFQYLSQLPVERLRELHFTGLHRVNDRWEDHLPILPADWPVLEWVLARIRLGEWPAPGMLAFEYGGIGGWLGENCDPQVIAAQVPQLYALLNGKGA